MIRATLTLTLTLALTFMAVVAAPARAQTTTLPTLPAGARLDLFLLAGQSNMAGRGVVEAQDKLADPNVWTLSVGGEWVPATDPIHFDKPKVAGVGLGRTFGIEYANAHPGAIVGLIPCAVGGVSLDQWKPDGKLYADAIARAKVAMRRGTIRGILWHQGESDARPEKIATYPERLDALLARFRADLGAAAAPLIVGQLGIFKDPEKNAGRVAFNQMIAKYPDGRPNVACVTSEGATSMGDDTHFDAASQREMGRRYAAAFDKLDPSKKDNR